MKNLRAFVVSALALASLTALAGTAHATTPTCVSFKRGVLGDVPDASIWAAYPNQVSGSDTEFDVGLYLGGAEEGVVGFGTDLSLIPAGSTINSAKLYLWTYSNTNEYVRVHRILSPWGEDTVTWNNFGGFDPTIWGAFNVVQYNAGYIVADITSLTQGWESGLYPNYGVLLEKDQTGTSVIFRASDFGHPEYEPHFDVCYTPPAGSIGSTVFFDPNDDGVQKPGDAGIPNISVHLYSDPNCDGVADGSIGSTLTDAAGHYGFTSLGAGCYVVNVDGASLPQGYVTSTFNAPLGVSLAKDQQYVAQAFGYTTLESIGDQVWLDSNGNGIYEPQLGEAGLNGVTVNLFDAQGLVASTVTSNSPLTGNPGHYLFPQLYPGTYTVAIDASNFASGGALFATAPASDADGVLDNLTSATILAGGDFLGADFSYRLTCGDGVCQDSESCGTCAADCGACPPVCGNGTCEAGETCGSCAADCGACPAVCGNGACESGESCSNCAADCGACPAVCGNGACENGEACGNCAADCGACPPVCGNGTCEASETCSNCAADCGACPAVCGNGTCEAGESCGTCAADCGACPAVCGNGTCEAGEGCGNCAADCGECPPQCGNGTCENGETCSSCTSDCGACPAVCGNGACENGETCSDCAADCGTCPPQCGNGTCEAGESCGSCAADCGACPAVCGNNICEAGETCGSCPLDCGTCPPVCGNGTCENSETCSSCAADCGTCPPQCGNGTCEAGESCGSCSADCGACPPVCGNNTCEVGESCGNCASDCGACPPVCGNEVCEAGETCGSCSADCGACPPVCGNGTCEAGESCGSCASDCGVCPPVCGNGACEAGESCGSCANDCGACPPVCGNKLCEPGETCSSCSNDCGACPPVCGNKVCEAGESCGSCSTDCGTCPPPAPGALSQGYWMNHPEAWPFQTMSLGGKTYTKAELINIMKNPTAGDVTYTIASQLIAAKLNVGAGNNSSCISATIAAADAWLAKNKLGSNVKASSSAWKDPGVGLKNTLEAYNLGQLCAPSGK